RQKRDSGEYFSNHCLRVATTLAEMKLDADTVAAGIIHDVLENAVEQGFQITAKDISEQFGETVQTLALGTQNSEWDFTIEDEEVPGYKQMSEAELTLAKDAMYDERTQQKILHQLSGEKGTDPRVILIKLADRLDNTRTIKTMKGTIFESADERQKRKADDTLKAFSIYAKITGEIATRNELADLAFEVVENDRFMQIWQAMQYVLNHEINVDWQSPSRYERVLAALSQIYNPERITEEMRQIIPLERIGMTKEALTVYLPGLYGMHQTWKRKKEKTTFTPFDLYAKMAIRIPDEQRGKQSMADYCQSIIESFGENGWEDVSAEYNKKENSKPVDGALIFIRQKTTGRLLRVFIIHESVWKRERARIADLYRTDADEVSKQNAQAKLDDLKERYLALITENGGSRDSARVLQQIGE
ncbi:HD domain-containing protein, partial [Candidatus Microgenomates bacterium]|nr:HD domain-containing protein [Candidatus Microgenomates bacterium]